MNRYLYFGGGASNTGGGGGGGKFLGPIGTRGLNFIYRATGQIAKIRAFTDFNAPWHFYNGEVGMLDDWYGSWAEMAGPAIANQ